MSTRGQMPLPSSSHAEDMDRMYRYQRYIYDLTRKYYLLGRDQMINDLNVPQGGSLLEIGCGTGRNLSLAQRIYPQACVFGLDISAEMLDTARSKLSRGGSVPKLRVADATQFTADDFGARSFDRIMISYALSMIPDWTSAIDQALAALAPRGSLHIVDFGQQERLPNWARPALQAWLRRFHVTPRADLKVELAKRCEVLGAELSFTAIARGYAWHAIVKR